MQREEKTPTGKSISEPQRSAKRRSIRVDTHVLPVHQKRVHQGKKKQKNRPEKFFEKST